MSNLNQKTILCLLLFAFHFANVSSQGVLPTGDILHESIDFPLSPVINILEESEDELDYYQVEFSSENVLDTYYESISTTPPDYTTEMRYFWTFGDGHTSYESDPVHQYVVGGIYEVTFQATPIYTPKPPPPLMKINFNVPTYLDGVLDVSSSAGTLPWVSNRLFLKAEMLRNFRSNFESSMIITYKSELVGSTNDAIQVYYNSQKVDAVAMYSFQGETVSSVGDIITSSLLGEELNSADKMLTIPFYDLAEDETRRILIQFVSNNSSETFDPSIYFGVNFENENFSEVPLIQTSLRRSWDPNAKEVFEEYISADDIPNTIKYRIYMENIGTESTYMIGVLDRVHPVLNIDPAVNAMVDSKYEVGWNYEPILVDHNVNYFAPDFNLPGQSPELNIEDSKYWFDVVYEIDNPSLQEKILISNGYCRNGVYKFGRNAKITFDDNDPSINTNTPLVEIGCHREDLDQCIEIKKIYPNPTYNTATLAYKIETTLREPLDIFALSQLGNMIPIASNLSAQKGVHTYNLDFSNLKPDIYHLIIKNRDCSARLEGFIKK